MDCPYHSQRWRSVFQCIINKLRLEGMTYFKSKHVRNIPQVICTCPGKNTSSHDCTMPAIPSDELASWCKGLKSNRELSNKSLIDALSRMHMASTDNSHLMNAIALAYHIRKGNVSFLEPKVKPQDSVAKPEPLTIEKEFFIDIPVAPTQYIGTLIGTNGTHLKKLCETHGISSIHLGEHTKSRKRIQNSFLYNTPVRVTYTVPLTHGKHGVFERALHERVSIIKKKRENHFEATQKFMKHLADKREERKRRFQAKEDETYEYTDVKVFSAGNYYQGKGKRNRTKSDQQKKGKFRNLQGGHCLHCLTSFKPDDTQCQYHPGYIVNDDLAMKVWSCCKKDHEDGLTPQEEHVSTGCTFGRHLWRPPKSKKTSKQGSGNSISEDLVVKKLF
ncbi:PREDICTED: uncharacterized protein LOC109581533 [Amphimedon queenslandica]|uniref:K Homology domain-containing protein n=1 Tax=Amphimedon queenslandica TaxID=400682 RepID=A0A1X7V1U0_AMPQE|nr:PREDICTED: uncharacterized protein LOC109581533 [Amphimedon queenslandica]|eukprot:XP_019851287.1 PREDICTED: uncharacterized protein LOC109581533 [Amphimedon queenslandica]